MRVFTAVSDAGSFSRAAVFLSMSQPLISRQIKTLEEELGVSLFYRNGRGVVLTEAGKLLHQYSRGILESVSRASAEVAAMRSSPTGRVAIGLPPSVGLVLTVPLVQRFRESFPLVAMRIAEGFSGHVLEWLAAGQIDVAVLYNAPRTGNLISEPLLEDELLLLGAHDGDPASLPRGEIEAERLTELPLILPSRPHGLRLLIDQTLGEVKLRPNVVLEVEAMPSTLRLVEMGVGYTILSYTSVHHLVEENRIKFWPIVNPRFTRQLILATSTQRPTTVPTRGITDLIRDEVKKMAQLTSRKLDEEGVTPLSEPRRT